ncbi:MAG: N-acetylmuramoyl-L-alanine amidase [Lachnospiraceae bacterium]|nr:N-acetylmuramoyl-L-alanine amidase [Lachnospiraceae bacterium]
MKRFLISVILILVSYICSKQGYHMVTTLMKPVNAKTVVIDAGHGGNDPGKVGINNLLEKDINLKIALYLKKYLEKNDIHVIMTREKDESLSTSTSNHKTSDLSNRKEIIFQNNPAAAISIHQNSYPSSSVHGAQVFYGENHENSKALAELLQSNLLKMDSTNHRAAKSNNSYYLFRDNPYATVIVECGFLSNPEEASWLNDPDYQKKIAWQLHLGILEYIKTMK